MVKYRIEELHEAYSLDVQIACQAFYAMKSLNTIPFHDKDIHRQMNRNARSWSITTHSLQVTTFITLGRIFDESDDSHSVHSLLNHCMRNRHEFRRGCLYRRKIRDGFDEKVARDYVRGLHPPCQVFFKRLKKTKTAYMGIYKSLYQSVRHNVFAHKVALSIEESQRHFNQTSIAGIEDILCFLYQLDRIIWQLINNGRMTDLCDHSCIEGSLMEKDVSKLLDSLVEPTKTIQPSNSHEFHCDKNSTSIVTRLKKCLSSPLRYITKKLCD